MLDPAKLTSWYNFQAPLYRLWRDDYDSPLVGEVATRIGGVSPEGRMLDAGCGTGLFSLGLADPCSGWNIEGIDASSGMVAVARKQAHKRELANVRFATGDVNALDFDDDSFDVVVAGGLFPNLNEAAPALREICRVLRDDGHLLVIEFDRESMTAMTRAFFAIMIAGYKLVSFFFRRFRFAEDWNLEKSTIDPVALKSDLRSAGFREVETTRKHAHLILHYLKGHGPCLDS